MQAMLIKLAHLTSIVRIAILTRLFMLASIASMTKLAMHASKVRKRKPAQGGLWSLACASGSGELLKALVQRRVRFGLSLDLRGYHVLDRPDGFGVQIG